MALVLAADDSHADLVVINLRISTRTNKNGSKASYGQLGHNTRDSKSGTPGGEILFNFGRREDVDPEALRRLVRSITRFLGP